MVMKRKHILIHLFLVSFLLLLISCQHGNLEQEQHATDPHLEKHEINKRENNTLTILAAASLIDVLEQIKPLYETTHDTTLTFVFGSSGKLARQIDQGAP